MTLLGTRTRNLFLPQSREDFRLSRSKIALFLECPRCFYLDRRLGIGRPDTPPYTLNNAVDHLLKREFDNHRALATPHPIMTEHGVDAVPLRHPLLETWRTNFQGVERRHQSGLVIFGAVDDLWVASDGAVLVVDYKATCTEKEISLDGDFRAGYKRQMEVYQWLLRGNGLPVSDVGYFLFVNADKNAPVFGSQLQFHAHLVPYMGNDDWVDDAVSAMHDCLVDDRLPAAAPTCAWCAYRQAARAKETQ